MQIFKKEFERLKNIKSIVNSKFPHLGVNKKQEIIRLLYEISKRENAPPGKIILSLPEDFNTLKAALLKRRFPYSHMNKEMIEPYLPKVKLNSSSFLKIEKKAFYPKNIFVEKKALYSTLTKSFRKNFPNAKFSEIGLLKEYLKANRNFTIETYNKRRDTIFITYENYDFFKKCPCTKNAVGCGYNIFNLSFGCLFECTYCYLQEYTNSPGIIFPANINRFFDAFGSHKKPGMRLGTGEFSDSLMLDHITGYSIEIIDFFKKHPDIKFEFKTKSVNIENLLKARHAGNIVVAWTFNPQKIIDENEFYTPALSERIKAAKKCVEAGYKISCHFDPVIYFNGWQKAYEKVMELLFSSIRPADIAWLSIGTLRFNPRVKQIIEARFPGNKILDQELLYGFDNKLRYPYSIRLKIYSSMLKILCTHSRKIPAYLCMEDISMWQDVKLKPGAIFR
jgi:spore photoproduct lyase